MKFEKRNMHFWWTSFSSRTLEQLFLSMCLVNCTFKLRKQPQICGVVFIYTAEWDDGSLIILVHHISITTCGSGLWLVYCLTSGWRRKVNILQTGLGGLKCSFSSRKKSIQGILKNQSCCICQLFSAAKPSLTRKIFEFPTGYKCTVLVMSQYMERTQHVFLWLFHWETSSTWFLLFWIQAGRLILTWETTK